MPRHEETTETQQAESPGGGHDESGGGMSYLRFGAMIAASMVFMYAVMYLNTFELAHVRWSDSRLFVTLLMGSTMAIIMLGFMLGMYKPAGQRGDRGGESRPLRSIHLAGAQPDDGSGDRVYERDDPPPLDRDPHLRAF